jgi:nitroreductase/NAD-dependent dihydropyrimidine dehydrogenase PreA subunit
MISTSRTSEDGTIVIDHEKCNGCGICVNVCKSFCLELDGKKLLLTNESKFGCIGCGQCVAVCANDAIIVTGRTLTIDDYSPLKHVGLDPESLYNLMLNRRSIRDFKSQPVPDELIDQILRMASTAPMGIPPSDVGVLLIKGQDKVREFSFDFIEILKQMQTMLKPVPFALLSLTMSKDDRKATREFLKPLVDFIVKSKNEGKDYLLYDAPLMIMFYSKQTADQADPVIAATYAMLAAESLGLGSCMIGTVGPFLKRMGKPFKAKYGLPEKMKDSLVLIVGYPKYKYHKTVRRTFAEVMCN